MEKLWFNFVMSIGPACRPARYLQQYGLRTQASPLDWQMSDSLQSILHLVRTSFDDFFTEIGEIPEYANDHCRYVVDTKNHIESMHHFPVSKDLSSGQVQFRQQMLHRWEKTDDAIKHSKRIALICNRKEPLRELKAFLVEFAKLYPNQKITLLNIRNADIHGVFRTENVISPDLKIVEYQFRDVHPNGKTRKTNPDFWLGNPEKWAYVMKQMKVINPNHFKKPCRYFIHSKNPDK